MKKEEKEKKPFNFGEAYTNAVDKFVETVTNASQDKSSDSSISKKNLYLVLK